MQVLGIVEFQTTLEPDGSGEPGELPTSLEGLGEYFDNHPFLTVYVRPNLPEMPVIVNEISASTKEEIENAPPGTRIIFSGAIMGSVTLEKDDTELVLTPGAEIKYLKTGRSVHRVYVHSQDPENKARIGEVITAVPAIWLGGTSEYREEYLGTDLIFEDLYVHYYPDSHSEWGGSAFLIRAHRCAILGCETDARRYGVWVGDAPWRTPITEGGFHIEDVILLNNDFRAGGPEATIRLVGTLRAAIIGNRFSNSGKANFRSHGDSANIWASGNSLIGGGVYVGSMPNDAMGDHWFINNTVQVTFLTNVNTWSAHGGTFVGTLELHDNRFIEPTWGSTAQWCNGFRGDDFFGVVNHTGNTLRGEPCDNCGE